MTTPTAYGIVPKHGTDARPHALSIGMDGMMPCNTSSETARGTDRTEGTKNMRPIDADELLTAFPVDDEPMLTKSCVRMTIRHMPTIESEVQPLRHGRWNCGDDMFEYAVCSCCKWDSGEAWEYAKKYFKYCPNCGARMVNTNGVD